MFKKIIISLLFLIANNINFDFKEDSDSGTTSDVVNNTINLDIESESGILIDYNSGKVLYSKNEEKKLYPASMTKMMGLYLVLNAIDNNIISLEDEVIVSSKAASMGGTQIFLQPNEVMCVEDLLKSVAINSANDAICALGETVSGSIESFVDLMNKTAKDFGCNNTNFVNPTGFHDENHYTTAKDMSIIAKRLLSFGDKILKYTSTYEDYIRKDTQNPFWLVNTNKLVKYYEGFIDGLKTGVLS